MYNAHKRVVDDAQGLPLHNGSQEHWPDLVSGTLQCLIRVTVAQPFRYRLFVVFAKAERKLRRTFRAIAIR
jgi:hypothetical protein